METLNAIENRRSIRKYTNELLSKEVIEDIINCGRLAPSAKNRQPWHIVIVPEEIKNGIANMMIDYANTTNDDIEPFDKSTITPTANVIKVLPILILIFRDNNPKRIIEDALSIGACVENMCLRATDLNVGSLWIRDTEYVQEEISKKLGLNGLELVCALGLGMADQSPKMRPRKELNEIMTWY